MLKPWYIPPTLHSFVLNYYALFSLQASSIMTSMDHIFVGLNQSISKGFRINFSIEEFEINQMNNEMFLDPFNSLWKKILGTVFYILQLLGGLIVVSFIRYETQGHAAHFRTALNQITSWLASVVS